MTSPLGGAGGVNNRKNSNTRAWSSLLMWSAEPKAKAKMDCIGWRIKAKARAPWARAKALSPKAKAKANQLLEPQACIERVKSSPPVVPGTTTLVTKNMKLES